MCQCGCHRTLTRFTLPWWEDEQRIWAEKHLARYLCRAQLLADTLHDQWLNGVDGAAAIRLIEEAAQLDDKTEHLLVKTASGKSAAILEPLAAGSARLIRGDRDSHALALVVDIGAGTTDISLFFVVEIYKREQRFGRPVIPCGRALRIGGDQIDSHLVQEIIRKSHLGADKALERRTAEALWRRGVRRLKAELFEVGQIEVKLPNDMFVTLTRDEFLGSVEMVSFKSRIEDEIQCFLNEVDESWRSVKDLNLVLTGGGATLPMIGALADREWKIGNSLRRFRKLDLVPEFVKPISGS